MPEVSGPRPQDGRVAIVTGAATGIGFAVAQAFGNAGAHTVLADRDGDAAQKAAGRIIENGAAAESVEVDIRDLAAVKALAADVARRCGRIDALVNNAGITIPGDLFSTTEEAWDAIQDVNLKGTFFCMQAVAAVMRDQGSGAIVNMASISGKGYRSTIAYAASKGGVLAITRIAAQELGPFGVTVNAIAPGFTADTAVMRRAIQAHACAQGVGEEQVIEEIAAVTARRRLVRPEEIGALAVFLASPAAAMITGQSVNIDGGLVFD